MVVRARLSWPPHQAESWIPYNPEHTVWRMLLPDGKITQNIVVMLRSWRYSGLHLPSLINIELNLKKIPMHREQNSPEKRGTYSFLLSFQVSNR